MVTGVPISGVDPLLGGGVAPVEAAHKPHLEQHPGTLDLGDHLVRRSERQRDRLLAEDRFSGARGLNRDLAVGMGRAGDQDGVHLRVGDQIAEIGVGLHAGQLGGQLVKRLGVRIGDGDQHGALDLPRGVQRIDAPHPPQPDHANPNASYERLR